MGIAAGVQGYLIRRDDCKERDTDDAFPWISIRFAKRAHLFEIPLRQPGFFAQFTLCGIGEIFIDAYKSTRQGPLTPEGGSAAFNEQEVEAVVSQCENHEIYGDCRVRMFVAIRKLAGHGPGGNDFVGPRVS